MCNMLWSTDGKIQVANKGQRKKEYCPECCPLGDEKRDCTEDGGMTRQTLSGRKSLKEHPRWEQQVPILCLHTLKGGCSKDVGQQENTVTSLNSDTTGPCPQPRGTYEPRRSSCFQRVQAKRPGGNTSEPGGCGLPEAAEADPTH